MFNFTKKFTLAASLVALFSGQFVAYGSGGYPHDHDEGASGGERDNKRHKISVSLKIKREKKKLKVGNDQDDIQQLVQEPERNKPLFGQNNNDVKLKIVDFLDGRSALNFSMVCFEASALIQLRGRVKLVPAFNPEFPVQRQLLRNTLKKLNLSSCHIGEAGAASLAQELGKLVRLTQLDLANNQIGAAGVASLAPELGKLVCLTQLGLTNNQIGAAGAASLTPELGKLVRLTVIYLANNQIGAAGAASLAPELGKLVCLTQLTLAGPTSSRAPRTTASRATSTGSRPFLAQ